MRLKSNDFCLYVLRLNFSVNFSVMWGRSHCFLGITSTFGEYFRGVKCLAQGHNTAEVGFKLNQMNFSKYRNDPKFSARQVWANNADPWVIRLLLFAIPFA